MMKNSKPTLKTIGKWQILKMYGKIATKILHQTSGIHAWAFNFLITEISFILSPIFFIKNLCLSSKFNLIDIILPRLFFFSSNS